MLTLRDEIGKLSPYFPYLDVLTLRDEIGKLSPYFLDRVALPLFAGSLELLKERGKAILDLV